MLGLSWWRHILSFFWNGLYILPLYNIVANFNEHQLNGNRLILLVLGRFFEHFMYRNFVWPRTLHVIFVFFYFTFSSFLKWRFRVRLDTSKNWKYCNKIIFKYVNSAVRLIFNESFVEKRSLWVVWTVHKIH